MTLARPLRVVVLMPLRDDWASASELIRRLDQTISPTLCNMEILLVDDGSLQRCPLQDFQGIFSTIQRVRSLRLRRNLGHQRAIAVGLVYVQQAIPCDAVVVMDADGEDTQDGVAQLLRAFVETEGTQVIFAERSRRLESISFRFFYWIYKRLHRILTGIDVRVGNFSILPANFLGTMVVLSELWNHYAAAVFRSRLPFSMTPIPRGQRIAGKSTMNFVALVTHGLSAIAVFGDVVGVRLLTGSLLGSMLAGLGILIVIGIRFLTRLAIPGWATYASGVLAIIMIQLITIATCFTFFVLANRTELGFVPLRDYAFFVEDTVTVFPHE